MAFRWTLASAALVVALAVIQCEAGPTGQHFEDISPRPDNSSEDHTLGPQPGPEPSPQPHHHGNGLTPEPGSEPRPRPHHGPELHHDDDSDKKQPQPHHGHRK